MEGLECDGDGVSYMEGGSTDNSFMGYMFSMNSMEKGELLNLIQYICLAIIPLIIFIKILHIYTPKYNEYKGSVEILIEVVLYIVVLSIVFWFINKFILYIPNYSKIKYDTINLFSMILPVVFILFTLEPNLNKKILLLSNRMMSYLGFTEPMTDYENQERIDTPPALKQCQQPVNLNIDYSLPENTRKEINNVPKNNSFGLENSYQENVPFNNEEPVAANTFTSF